MSQWRNFIIIFLVVFIVGLAGASIWLALQPGGSEFDNLNPGLDQFLADQANNLPDDVSVASGSCDQNGAILCQPGNTGIGQRCEDGQLGQLNAYDACARQISEPDGTLCADISGLTRFSQGEGSNGAFVGCRGTRNVFCSEEGVNYCPTYQSRTDESDMFPNTTCFQAGTEQYFCQGPTSDPATFGCVLSPSVGSGSLPGALVTVDDFLNDSCGNPQITTTSTGGGGGNDEPDNTIDNLYDCIPCGNPDPADRGGADNACEANQRDGSGNGLVGRFRNECIIENGQCQWHPAQCSNSGGGGGGGGGSVPEPEISYCGGPCNSDSDCQAPDVSVNPVCRNGTCVNPVCENSTVPGANCACQPTYDGTCGQPCGNWAGGVYCDFNDNVLCVHTTGPQCISAGERTYCVPTGANLPAGYSLPACQNGESNAYLSGGGKNSGYTEAEIQALCEAVIPTASYCTKCTARTDDGNVCEYISTFASSCAEAANEVGDQGYASSPLYSTIAEAQANCSQDVGGQCPVALENQCGALSAVGPSPIAIGPGNTIVYTAIYQSSEENNPYPSMLLQVGTGIGRDFNNPASALVSPASATRDATFGTWTYVFEWEAENITGSTGSPISGGAFDVVLLPDGASIEPTASCQSSVTVASSTEAVFQITKTAAEVCTDANDARIDYTVTVTNVGAVSGVIDQITDTYDSVLTALGIVPFGLNPSDVSVSNGVITWAGTETDRTFAPGQSRTYSYTFTLTEQQKEGITILTNTATVTYDTPSQNDLTSTVTLQEILNCEVTPVTSIQGGSSTIYLFFGILLFGLAFAGHTTGANRWLADKINSQLYYIFNKDAAFEKRTLDEFELEEEV